MSEVILLMGSNIGERLSLLMQAIDLIKEEIGTVILASSIYESEPWGYSSKNKYLNQALIVKTNLLPDRLLEKLQGIERQLGRKSRSKHYQDRTIDIDILFYDDIEYQSQKLTIPHPHLHERRFTLEPLAEIAGEYLHPIFKLEIKLLKQQVNDDSVVRLFSTSKASLS
jgi:2-amino-4-hydroxy-6-hydroxymethyldihydropteridine diphosphokinase